MTGEPPARETLLALVDAAVRAPSSHNTQPWRFRVAGQVIELLADRSRALPVNDPEDRELTISCGCALLNLRVAAAARGLACRIEPLPDPGAPDLLARVTLGRTDACSLDTALAGWIEARRTDRRGFAGGRVPAHAPERLARAAAVEGATLRTLAEAAARREVARLVREGDARQWGDPAWRRELAHWLRPRGRGEGLPVPALAAPLARAVVRGLNLGRRVGARDAAFAEAAPLLVVLGTEGDDPSAWLDAGQALERVLLTACSLGLQAAYVNQPLQVAALRPRLAELAGAGVPQILLRLGHPRGTLPPAPRRALESVLAGPPGRAPQAPLQVG